MLALVEKPTTTWTWLNMLLMLTNVTSNPMEKGIRQQVQNQKLVSKFCKLLQRTNQTSNVKGVSRTDEGKSLIMTIAWRGKNKRSHTMWVFEFYTTFIEKCATVNMDKSGNCIRRGSKTMKSNQLLCGKGVPCKDEGLEKGKFP